MWFSHHLGKRGPSQNTLCRNIFASRTEGSPGGAGTPTYSRSDGAAGTPPSSGVHITGEEREGGFPCSPVKLSIFVFYFSFYETETKESLRTNNQLLRERPFKTTPAEAKASSTRASKERSPKKENNGRSGTYHKLHKCNILFHYSCQTLTTFLSQVVNSLHSRALNVAPTQPNMPADT